MSSLNVTGILNSVTAAAAVTMNDDVKVPSRIVVKKISAQTSLEARRKEDMEIRRKK